MKAIGAIFMLSTKREEKKREIGTEVVTTTTRSSTLFSTTNSLDEINLFICGKVLLNRPNLSAASSQEHKEIPRIEAPAAARDEKNQLSVQLQKNGRVEVQLPNQKKQYFKPGMDEIKIVTVVPPHQVLVIGSMQEASQIKFKLEVWGKEGQKMQLRCAMNLPLQFPISFSNIYGGYMSLAGAFVKPAVQPDHLTRLQCAMIMNQSVLAFCLKKSKEIHFFDLGARQFHKIILQNEFDHCYFLDDGFVAVKGKAIKTYRIIMDPAYFETLCETMAADNMHRNMNKVALEYFGVFGNKQIDLISTEASPKSIISSKI
jgi:hypothetical protein